MAYERNKNLLGHELCTSHILTTTRQEAVEVIKLLDSGQSFEDLAITFSTEPGSGSQGGYLGCVPLGAFVPSFERAVLGGLGANEEIPSGSVSSRTCVRWLAGSAQPDPGKGSRRSIEP